jgi:hypothetical protein
MVKIPCNEMPAKQINRQPNPRASNQECVLKRHPDQQKYYCFRKQRGNFISPRIEHYSTTGIQISTLQQAFYGLNKLSSSISICAMHIYTLRQRRDG